MTQAASDDVVDDLMVDPDDEQADQESELEQTDEADTGDEGEQEQETESDGGSTDVADEVVVSIGEDPPSSEEDEFHGQPAPQWAKDLRKQYRDVVRENRELKAKAASAAPAEKAVALGAKPTLDSCDYDPERFERELTAWHARKREADEQERKKQDAEAAAQKQWQARLDTYGKAKAELKVSDFDDAEASAQAVLSTSQQGLIVHGADNPALLVYAIGKNPKKAAELAAIQDPVKFAFAVAKLEKELKVTPRKTAPPPERTVRSNGGGTAVQGKARLESLRDEARRTGDYTKYLAAKNQQTA